MTVRYKILTIVGSSRKLGNSEVIAKVVSKELINKYSVDIELLRLTDFNISYCKGCISCIVNKTNCSINDDLHFIHKKIDDSDGILFCMPIYCCSPPAILKLLLERSYSTTNYKNFYHKKVALIAIGTIKEQGSIVQALFDMFIKFMMFQSIGSLIIGGANGPGSILLNQKALGQAIELGEQLILNIENELINECPFCKMNIVSINDLSITCPLCGKSGKIVDNRICWMEDSQSINLDSHELVKRFATGKWADSTIRNYKNELHEIITLKKEYRNNKINIPWVQKTYKE